MIDPILSLAFSVHGNKGVYAVLLGSGISRSAQIPTGWEIVIELIRKLARLRGEDCEPDPAAWYRTAFGQEPDYSQILNDVAATPSERQQLLRSYFEPTSEERAESVKSPTKAHLAIAELVSRGYIRVIVTTNFDRLMEMALERVGVVPTVLSTPDHIKGMLPLVHTQCCIIKVHGDYLDTRIKNTPEELAGYDSEVDILLDQVFDEFGLLVCGWSAEWDEALKAAILRARNRRFSLYWGAHGQPGEQAKQLLQFRGGQVISIQNADQFFTLLEEKVVALESFEQPHPLSAKLAIVALKKYLSEEKYRIQLGDFISAETEKAVAQLNPKNFPLQAPQISTEALTERLKHYEAICENPLALGVTGSFWGKSEHRQLWERMLKRFLQQGGSYSGLKIWGELRLYPASLFFYATGIAAIFTNDYELLHRTFSVEFLDNDGAKLKAVQRLPAFCLLQRDVGQMLEGMNDRYAPLNDWIHTFLRVTFKDILPDDSEYDQAFDRFELFAALAYLRLSKRPNGHVWAPPGRFGYQHRHRDEFFQALEASFNAEGNQSRYVSIDVFGQTVTACRVHITELREFISKLQWY